MKNQRQTSLPPDIPVFSPLSKGEDFREDSAVTLIQAAVVSALLVLLLAAITVNFWSMCTPDGT